MPTLPSVLALGAFAHVAAGHAIMVALAVPLVAARLFAMASTLDHHAIGGFCYTPTRSGFALKRLHASCAAFNIVAVITLATAAK